MGLSDESLGMLLTAGSGMATTIGASVVLFPQLANLKSSKFLAVSLSVSAGVMLYVSLIEIFVKARNDFAESSKVDGDDPGEGDPYVFATLGFFAGIALTFALNRLVHCLDKGHSHHIDDIDKMDLDHLNATPHPGQPGLMKRPSSKKHLQEGDLVAVGAAAAPSAAAAAADTTATASPEDVDVEAPTPATAAPTDAPTSEAKPVDVEDATTATAAAAADVKPDADDISVAKSSTTVELTASNAPDPKTLQRTGLLTALALALHNIPEGLATFVATVDDPSVGAALAVAIALHNIPEGVCVAVPVFYASGSRWKGFLYSFISGVAELVGAAIGWVILDGENKPEVSGWLFAVVAGIMTYIALVEMIPTAMKYEPDPRFTTGGLVVGMAVMALSLVLFVA